jgi:hypothetical protein
MCRYIVCTPQCKSVEISICCEWMAAMGWRKRRTVWRLPSEVGIRAILPARASSFAVNGRQGWGCRSGLIQIDLGGCHNSPLGLGEHPIS